MIGLAISNDTSFIYDVLWTFMLVHFTITRWILMVPACVIICSLSGDPYKYNILPPLPARNYMPPSAQRPQQPVSISDNYNLPRFTRTESPNSSNSRSKRADINIWIGKAFLQTRFKAQGKRFACWIRKEQLDCLFVDSYLGSQSGFPLSKADFFSFCWLLDLCMHPIFVPL